MRRTIQASSTSDLFDLPLLLDPPGAIAEDPATTKLARPEPAADATAEATERLEQIELPEEADAAEDPAATAATGLLRRRLLAGGLDVALTGAGLTLAAAGAAALGPGPRIAHWPGYALLALTLSFVYAVYSLAFWSRTPGMARARLSARTDQQAPISFGQAIRRWLGGIVTVGLLGLPMLLLAWRRPSLADLLSGTRLES